MLVVFYYPNTNLINPYLIKYMYVFPGMRYFKHHGLVGWCDGPG